MEKVKVGAVSQLYRGISYKKEQASKVFSNGMIAILRAGNIEQGKFVFNDLVYVPSELVTQEQYINEGDIVITMSSGSKQHVGKAAIAANSMDCSYGAFCGKIVPIGVFPKFLYYALCSGDFRKHIEQQSKGTNINNIKQSYILDYEFIFPTLSEQKRIVARIEELFSQLDSGVETLKKVKQQLAVYRQAVLKEAFEGDFSRVRLGEVAQALSGYAFRSKKYSEDGKYVVVKIGNVKELHFDFSRDFTKTTEVDDSILNRYLLQKGDCLITLTGSRGKRDYGYVAMITNQTNFLLNQRVAALRFDPKVAVPKFYQYYLSSPDYRNQFFSYETGNVGQGNVGIKALSEPIVVCPPIEKQQEIVSTIESKMSTCDSIEKTVNTALQQTETMRQSILTKAFEGG